MNSLLISLYVFQIWENILYTLRFFLETNVYIIDNLIWLHSFIPLLQFAPFVQI